MWISFFYIYMLHFTFWHNCRVNRISHLTIWFRNTNSTRHKIFPSLADVIPVQPDLTQTGVVQLNGGFGEKLHFPVPPSPAQSRAPLLDHPQQRSLTPSSTGKPQHSGSCPSVISSSASTSKLKKCRCVLCESWTWSIWVQRQGALSPRPKNDHYKCTCITHGLFQWVCC